MTKEEAMKCRYVAKMYRDLQKENEKLRRELDEKNRIDLRMNVEDEQVFSLIKCQKPVHGYVSVVHSPVKPVFDFDTAEIEPVDAEFICTEEQGGRSEASLGYLARFGIFVLLESAVWLAHHLGWIDLIMAMGLSLFVFLFSRMRIF
ncbi:MAG: hypothetical protein PUK18_02485 [Firmicutes bacterium]|nr:hypothetical protein [Bacillota bacterium]MDY6159306.1 hypothetical protein [Candidatus Faecousia sp.]